MAEREPIYRRLADLVIDTTEIDGGPGGGGDPGRPAGTGTRGGADHGRPRERSLMNWYQSSPRHVIYRDIPD